MKSYMQLGCLFFIVFFELGSACVQFCDVRDWGAWQPCNATCGSGVQIREKNICCDNARYPTLKQCLISCSIPFSFWQANATEQKVCGKCQQGGTFNASHHRCDCPLGYEGSCCDALVIRKRHASARCIGKPCQNGTCIPIHGRFSCLCFAGYEGEKCDIDTDDCLKQPCLFGKCSDKINDFQCDCMVFFEGKICNKLKPWAIAILALTALALLLMCCCFCCMMGKDESDNENEKERRKRKFKPTSPRIGPTEEPKPQASA
ncbi:unnamed protein product [Mytilus coruscus]|uniref:EGF-like domain-containing protein n=1 Tax=Mytilus coruscus TaxID=42192 RepID=A0A6J8CR52_MYTCO|nr:unnamed protein product [Mytilus coruscus]